MNFNHIIGVDISKKTFDVALCQHTTKDSMAHHSFTNNSKGYKQLTAWLKKENIALNQILICLENTGLYHRALVAFLQAHQAFVWVENAVEIKWSMGLQRGKTDTVDAQRIALYAFRNQDKAKAYQQQDAIRDKLADLLAARERLIKASSQLLVPIKEMKEAGLDQQARIVEKVCKQSLLTLKKGVKGLEEQVKELIEGDDSLQKQYNAITSVPGVGMITALQLMVHTHHFKRFASAKKLACYAGVAPFPYQSGSSVRGRNKVHPMANKTLKTALHMCALSVIRFKGEMRAYFDRKVKEGKNKMSILNAIRNKLLQRIFACDRDGRLFVAKVA
jgi:transposase